MQWHDRLVCTTTYRFLSCIVFIRLFALPPTLPSVVASMVARSGRIEGLGLDWDYWMGDPMELSRVKGEKWCEYAAPVLFVVL